MKFSDIFDVVLTIINLDILKFIILENSVAIILQARNKSTRLPRKVMKDLGGRPLLHFLLERLKKCKKIDEIFIATTTNIEDNSLEDLANKLNCKTIRGSENDVLSRFFLVSKKTKSNVFVRITGDCPLIDPKMLDSAVDLFKKNSYDYLSNCNPPTFPDGLDIEIFSREVLISAEMNATSKFEREHVTPWMKQNKTLKKHNIVSEINYSDFRWTIDEPEDLEVIRNIVKNFKNSSDFSWREVIELNIAKPDLFEVNSRFKRNEGSNISTGQKLWKRAKRVIPGGNMLLSKRPELYLPEFWPAYFSKAQGCEVRDIDNNVFIDMSIMAIGTNTLGYGHPEVDKSVKKIIESGNMSTLNCPEEVFLAEKLVDLHPWSDMVRFARTGGEANAIAIRIARAATGLDKIAFCGYHGWHDWYLSSNLNKYDQLDKHLLPGLEPKGVPKDLKGTTYPFTYNNLDELENIFSSHKLAAVKMEVERSNPPKKGFLEGVRKLCDKNGAVLIFDECTSGFRETMGGLHKKYGVDPDIAIFGKALGNGYAITAVLGRENVMSAAQSTFISSTFWTERIGPTAALATLDVMEKEKSWEKITSLGIYVRNGWDKLAKKYHIEITHLGIPALAGYVFKSENHLKYKTYISQEMLKKGYLATNGTYLSTAHDYEIINKYLKELDPIFKQISECENESKNSIDNLLNGPVCHSGFKRLN